jgi:hypothetical protein
MMPITTSNSTSVNPPEQRLANPLLNRRACPPPRNPLKARVRLAAASLALDMKVLRRCVTDRSDDSATT